MVQKSVHHNHSTEDRSQPASGQLPSPHRAFNSLQCVLTAPATTRQLNTSFFIVHHIFRLKVKVEVTPIAAKKNKYWTDRFLADRGTPAKLWQSLSKILWRDKELDSSAASPKLSADQFIQFFCHKVEKIRKDTENCPCLLYTSDAADE